MMKESVQKIWDDLRGHGRMRCAAWRLLHARQFEPASEMIELGRKRFPGSLSFEILHARYCLLSDQRDLAANVLKKIAGRTAEDVFDQFELADTYRLMDRHLDAIELFESLKTTGKLNLSLLANQRLSSMYHRLDRPENALKAALDCVRLGGWQRQKLVLQLARTCSDKSIESAIADSQAIKLTKFYPEAQRLRFIAYLATALDRWELAIESIAQATKQSFFAEHDAELWDDSQPPLRPGILIIGAMKSGTTGLFKQLLSHPQFFAPLDKELHFFPNRNWPDEFYFAQFPRVVSQSRPNLTGEASPGYYIFDIVDRVKRMLPDTKIAFIKRDPVDRAISHLFHNRQTYIKEHRCDALTTGMDTVLDLFSLNDDSLRAALRDFEVGKKATNRYLLMGCYELLMRRWKAAFASEQVLELEFSDFTSATQKTMDRLFAFVGLATHKVDESLTSNSGQYKHDSAEFVEIKKRLADFYARVNEQ